MNIVVLKELELGSKISILEPSNLVASSLECSTSHSEVAGLISTEFSVIFRFPSVVKLGENFSSFNWIVVDGIWSLSVIKYTEMQTN